MKSITTQIKLGVFILLISLNFQVAFSQSFSQSNLPIIIIKTVGDIPNDYKIEGEISIIDHGVGAINKVTDTPNDYKGSIGIETRGSSSQFFYPKKSYGFETRDAAGKDLDTTLLGMPSESDWILYAPYGDKTMLRDVVAYHLSNQAGHYASRTRFCELLVNNEYMGVYVLLEKVKRNKNRVSVSKLEETDVETDSITGGYILKLDRRDPFGGDGFYSKYANEYGHYFIYEYPDPKKINDAQQKYIQNFINEFETALKSDNFAEPELGYAHYIKISSFVDYFILTELTKNIDAFRLSTFMYKEKKSKGDKLHMGPMWDYNLAFGNADYCEAQSWSGWAKDHAIVCPGEDIILPFWWDRLLEDPAYKMKLKERWNELRQSIISTGPIDRFIDSSAVVLEDGQKRNYQKWPILGQKVWPNYYVGMSYKDEINYFKEWIAKRIQWLDQQWGPLTPIDEELKKENSLKIYPNPFHRSVFFKYDESVGQELEFTVCDLNGRKVSRITKFVKKNGSITAEWDGKSGGAEVSNGLYIGILKSNGTIVARKKFCKYY